MSSNEMHEAQAKEFLDFLSSLYGREFAEEAARKAVARAIDEGDSIVRVFRLYDAAGIPKPPSSGSMSVTSGQKVSRRRRAVDGRWRHGSAAGTSAGTRPGSPRRGAASGRRNRRSPGGRPPHGRPRGGTSGGVSRRHSRP